MAKSYFLLNEELLKLNALRRIATTRAAGEAGLHMGQLRVLEFIGHHRGCTQKDIADALQVTPASIALSTKRLQKAGLVEKQVDETNLRCNMLYVTPKAEEISRICRDKFDAIDAVMFQGLSDDELDWFDTLMTRMIENMTEAYHIEGDTHAVMALASRMQSQTHTTEEETLC